jgi:hypothetical protein
MVLRKSPQVAISTANRKISASASISIGINFAPALGEIVFDLDADKCGVGT